MDTFWAAKQNGLFDYWYELRKWAGRYHFTATQVGVRHMSCEIWIGGSEFINYFNELLLTLDFVSLNPL